MKKNLILIVIIVAAFLVGGGAGYFFLARNGGHLSNQEAGNKAIEFINKNLLAEGTTASLVSSAEENGVYKVRLKIGENEYDSFVTKNGKLLFVEGIDMEPTSTPTPTATNTEIPKKDTPDVKLFVMSYCPYGLQAEKMFLPVYNLLKDKAEMAVYFVDYAMHEKKEIDENLRQYCIEQNEKGKYYDYLSCFVGEDNFEKCLTEANINEGVLNTCISETDAKYKITQNYNDKSTWVGGNYPKFDAQTDLNEKYGIQGSPTIIINDTEATVNQRSPEEFKKIVCQTFTTPPTECSQTLSSDVSSTGFGVGTTDSTNNEGCAQ